MSASQDTIGSLGPYRPSGTLSGAEIHISADLDDRRDLVPVVGERRPRIPVSHPVGKGFDVGTCIGQDRGVGAARHRHLGTGV
jgi:hypothetical protein